MSYFLNNIIFILLIQILSLYLNSNHKLKLNQTYLIALVLIATAQYVLFEINLLFISEYFFSSIFFFLIYILYKNKKNHDFDYKSIFIYNLIFIFFLFLYKDKYYLDQDEFSYWGKLLKLTFLADKIDFDLKNLSFYQFPFLNYYNYLTMKFIGFREDAHLFSNNLFIIFSIIFLIKEKTISYNFFLKFIIIFLILNCLSFGLVSIYADPIIAIIGGCIFYVVYQNKIKPEPNDFFKILLLIVPLILSHKFGLVIFTGVIFMLIINYYKNFSLKNLLIILLFSYLIHLFYSNNITYRVINSDLSIELINKVFLKESYYFFKKILIFPITYSTFFDSFNKIVSLFGLESLSIKVLKTTTGFWLLLFLFLSFFLQIKDKLRILIFFFIFFLSSFLIIFTIKIYLNNLSPYAFIRYYSIILASSFIFLISIIDFKKNSNLRLILILFLFLSMAPKKTFSLFVNDKIYYSQKENINFYKNRLIIKNFSNKYNNYSYEKIKDDEVDISKINEIYHPAYGLRLGSKVYDNLINQKPIKIIIGDKISNYSTVPELFFYLEILNFELSPLINLEIVTIDDSNLEIFDFEDKNIFIFNPKSNYNKYPSIKLN